MTRQLFLTAVAVTLVVSAPAALAVQAAGVSSGDSTATARDVQQQIKTTKNRNDELRDKVDKLQQRKDKDQKKLSERDETIEKLHARLDALDKDADGG